MDGLKLDSDLSKGVGNGEFEFPAPWVSLGSIFLLSTGLLLAGVLMASEAMPLAKNGTFQKENWVPLVPANPFEKVEEVANETGPLRVFTESLRKTTTAIADPVRWPQLKLAGFGSGAGGGGYAIINGSMVRCGEWVNKVQVIEVQEGCVIVELQGERKTLTMTKN